RSGYDTTRVGPFYARVEDALAAIPGVTGETSSGVQLLSGSNWGQGVSVEGFQKTPDTDDNARFDPVGAGYFHTMRIPVLQGRDFTAGDNALSARVAIVNQTFAKKFHLGTDVVGKHMSVGNDSLNIEIVGLVEDAKYSEVKDSTPPLFFQPWRQVGYFGGNNFYVRSSLPPAQIMSAIRATMKSLDPSLPLEDMMTLEQQAKENVFLDRMISTLSASFAVLATLLAAIGLYGVLAY